MKKYKKVMIKISGEALGSDKGALDPKKMSIVASNIARLADEDVEIAIVVGGGNIFRGRDASLIGIDRHDGDYMGMLGTIINSMALQSALEKLGNKCSLFSSIEVKGVVPIFSRREALSDLASKKIVIFAAGTGHPYFSTDTTAALRAAEIGSEVLLMAKNEVDGVYDADPKLVKTAKKYDTLTYIDFLSKNLTVMDSTAVTLCMTNNIEIIVFNVDSNNALLDHVNGKITGTLIKGE